MQIIESRISNEIWQQSQVVKLQRQETKREELKKMLEVDIKYIHPSPKSGVTNNIADLRKPPKKYIPSFIE